jgi:hypothetical protein
MVKIGRILFKTHLPHLYSQPHNPQHRESLLNVLISHRRESMKPEVETVVTNLGDSLFISLFFALNLH